MIWKTLAHQLPLIRHHTNMLQMGCRILTTGSPCAGYNSLNDVNNTANQNRSRIYGYSASYVVTGYYMPLDGNVYLWATWNTLETNLTPVVGNPAYSYGPPVIVCIQVGNGNVAPKLCPTPHYLLSTTILRNSANNPPWYVTNYAQWMTSVNRYYLLESVSHKLYCWWAKLAM